MRKYNPHNPLISIHIPKCGGTTLENILQYWFNNKRKFPNFYNHPRVLSILWPWNLDIKFQQLFGYGFVKHSDFHVRGYKPRKISSNMFFDILRIKKTPICIHGHFDPHGSHTLKNCYPNASQFVTLLRDPLEIAKSMYYYRKQLMISGAHFKGKMVNQQLDLTLDEYLYNNKSYMFSSWPWDLKKSNYRRIIDDNFIFIGVVEEFQKSIEQLARVLNKEVPSYNVLNRTDTNKVQPDKNIVDRFLQNNELEFEVYNYVKGLIMRG